MAVQHTDPTMVTAAVTTLQRTHYGTGYGRKIPTRFMIRYGTQWKRVYVVNYGNAGSAYVVHRGQSLYLDIDTEYLLSEGLTPETWNRTHVASV